MCSVCKYGFDQFFRYGEVIGFGRFLGKVMVAWVFEGLGQFAYAGSLYSYGIG